MAVLRATSRLVRGRQTAGPTVADEAVARRVVGIERGGGISPSVVIAAEQQCETVGGKCDARLVAGVNQVEGRE